MIVFVLLCLLSLGFIPLAILVKTKKVPFGAGVVAIVVLCTLGVMNLTSGIYHVVGNEDAYHSALSTREAILAEESALLALPEEERPQKQVEDVKTRARYFNLDLESDRDLADSIWVGMYAFRFAAEHFDEPYITLAL